MKFKLFALVLTLALGISPVMAQGGPSHTVTFDSFRFSFDSSLGSSLNITQSDGANTFPQDSPHTQFLFYSQAPAPESLFDARAGIRLYKVADFAGNNDTLAQLDQLQTLLTSQEDLSPYMTVSDSGASPSLPFVPMLPAGQVIRARAQYVSTPAVNGISYVTAFQEAVEPFLSKSFLYVFQGFSTDGQYFVSVIVPLNTAAFPSDFPPDYDATVFMQGLNDYLRQSTSLLNEAAPESFTPSLTAADALVQSFAFGAAPAS